MTDSTRFPVLDSSLDALRSASAGAVGRLDAPSPCAGWTAGQVLEHAVLDQLIWVSTVSGTSGPDGDAFAPTGHHFVAADEAVASAVQSAHAAWRRADPEVNTPLPQGSMPAATAAAACALDAAVHAWDIALATGQPSPLADDLATELLPVARSIVEPLRQWGAFAPALAAQQNDGAADALLRYLGRDPRWK